MGQRIEAQEFYIEVKVDSSDSNITYVGKGILNSDGDTSRPIWQIMRIIENGNDASIKYADGDVKFDNVFDDRESLTYK